MTNQGFSHRSAIFLCVNGMFHGHSTELAACANIRSVAFPGGGVSEETHLLVVDDEADIRETVREYFGVHGFAVHEAANGSEMRARMAEHDVSLVLLDLRMPGEDGFALCRYLREHSKVGIVMLTGSQDAVDRVIGLEIGADDYVAKPFDLRELLARVRSVLRRLPGEEAVAPKTANVVDIGASRLNLDTQVLRTVQGDEIVLGAMEFDLLRAFVENPDRVLTRDQLLNLAHNRDWDPFDRSIDVRVTRLRKKIEPDPSQPQFIRTVRGTGYLFSLG